MGQVGGAAGTPNSQRIFDNLESVKTESKAKFSALSDKLSGVSAKVSSFLGRIFHGEQTRRPLSGQPSASQVPTDVKEESKRYTIHPTGLRKEYAELKEKLATADKNSFEDCLKAMISTDNNFRTKVTSHLALWPNDPKVREALTRDRKGLDECYELLKSKYYEIYRPDVKGEPIAAPLTTEKKPHPKNTPPPIPARSMNPQAAEERSNQPVTAERRPPPQRPPPLPPRPKKVTAEGAPPLSTEKPAEKAVPDNLNDILTKALQARRRSLGEDEE